MSTDNPHAILMQRSLEMHDVAGVYALAAKTTASRLAEVKAVYDSGAIDDDQYLKLLRAVQCEDQLMTSAARNMDKAVEIRDKPAAHTITVDYDAKLKAIK
jgi:hypothetical protein